LLPWLTFIEAHDGPQLAREVLYYVVDRIEGEDESLFIQKVSDYLSETLQGEVMTLAQRFAQKGRQEGIQQGRQEGECLFLVRLLKYRFGAIPSGYMDQIQAADPEQLLIWGERVLEDVFK